MDERLNEILSNVFEAGVDFACSVDDEETNEPPVVIEQAKNKIYELIEFSEIELEDIKVWANGIQGVLGSEYADRVTEEESKISYLILNPEKVVPNKKINDDSIYGVLEKCYIWNRVEKPNKASKYLMERQAESIVDFIKKGRDSK